MQLKNGVTPGRGYQSITRKKRMLTKSCDGVDDVDLDDEEAAEAEAGDEAEADQEAASTEDEVSEVKLPLIEAEMRLSC